MKGLKIVLVAALAGMGTTAAAQTHGWADPTLPSRVVVLFQPLDPKDEREILLTCGVYAATPTQHKLGACTILSASSSEDRIAALDQLRATPPDFEKSYSNLLGGGRYDRVQVQVAVLGKGRYGRPNAGPPAKG